MSQQFKHLKALEMIQKQKHWVKYKLKSRKVEKERFQHPIVTADDKWMQYPKGRTLQGK